jgi:hypothetical protein
MPYHYDTIPISRFFGGEASRSVHGHTQRTVKVLVYGHQSIDMHIIVVPVKLGSELSMSILRNKQFFHKP